MMTSKINVILQNAKFTKYTTLYDSFLLKPICNLIITEYDSWVENHYEVCRFYSKMNLES